MTRTILTYTAVLALLVLAAAALIDRALDPIRYRDADGNNHYFDRIQ